MTVLLVLKSCQLLLEFQGFYLLVDCCLSLCGGFSDKVPAFIGIIYCQLLLETSQGYCLSVNCNSYQLLPIVAGSFLEVPARLTSFPVLTPPV